MRIAYHHEDTKSTNFKPGFFGFLHNTEQTDKLINLSGLTQGFVLTKMDRFFLFLRVFVVSLLYVDAHKAFTYPTGA